MEGFRKRLMISVHHWSRVFWRQRVNAKSTSEWLSSTHGHSYSVNCLSSRSCTQNINPSRSEICKKTTGYEYQMHLRTDQCSTLYHFWSEQILNECVRRLSFAFRLGHQSLVRRSWSARQWLRDESSRYCSDISDCQDTQCPRPRLLRNIQILRACSDG